ncbi:MAG: hypothetical protein J0L51_07170 [Rhizobiales bacterium]|nr:hypothetical protein [Hyphomicrobiales bacterium]
MIGALFTGAAEGGLKLSRGLVLGLVIAGLFAAAGLGFWRGMAAIERMVETARIEERASRDAHWRKEIAESNAKAETERARQAVEAAASSAAAERAIGSLTQSLIEWETRHAQTGADQNCISPERRDALNRLRGHRTGGP